MNNEMMPPNEAFRLNMQIITDELEDSKISIDFHTGNDSGCLSDVRLYDTQTNFNSKYVYIALAKDLPLQPPVNDISFVILGTIPCIYKNSKCSIIQVNMDDDHIIFIFNMVQNIFEKYRKWDECLQYALNHDLGVDELCRISINVFKNPIFVHDPQFYIIACPIQVPGMLPWDLDEHTNMNMVPLELINDFKIDPEYISTLDTVGPQMFSANIRGYRILYMNLWSPHGRYEGRICLDEILYPLKPGYSLMLEYLVKVIKIALRRHNLSKESFIRPIELLITDILNQTTTDSQIIANQIQSLGWKLEDQYVCIKIVDKKRSMDNMAIISTCNYIEAIISRSLSFKYENNIVVIINLTSNGSNCDDCLTQLAYIIREGLFNAGVSNVYRNFAMTSFYYQQTELALRYGELNDNTIWCHRFDNYVLQYMLDNCCNDFPTKILCPEGLLSLIKYDSENETEFFKTLKVYLNNERRTTQTAKELFIHRSTLFYRLDRIEQILKVNLEDPYVRLYINICICLLNKMT